ncbi:internal scaffolding protein [robinz microvirus RP_41]|nr:internal scaffolding protein [robinz microvirus RP_41]
MDGNEKLYDFVARSEEAGLLCEDPSLCVQSQAEDADINVIIDRFGLTGQIPTNLRVPESQDFGDYVFDFASAQRVLIEGANEFMKLPAKIRSYFDHDPATFMNFMQDPANADELIDMGLRVRPVIVPAPDVPAKE